MSFFSCLTQLLSEREIHFAGTHTLKTTDVLLPTEKKAIKPAGEYRQNEFATGRWCAREACARIGISPQPILRGREEEPLWPKGICGSISHTRGAWCAVTAFSRRYCSLGIDIESQTRAISRDALMFIANEDEHAWLERIVEKRTEYEKLIFCAKESIFKCLYPIIRKRFSFSAFSLLQPLQTGEFVLVINEHLHSDFRQGRRFQGIYFTSPDWLVTLSYLNSKH